MDNGGSSFGQDLAYDLRQRYAKIVGDHLEDVSTARRERKYSDYFRALEDLYVITQHKFKNKTNEVRVTIKKKGAKDKIEKRTISYETFRAKIIAISNEHSHAWKGEGTDTKEIAEIEKALRDAEKFLFSKMDDANMFGSKRETEGLI